MSNDKHYINDHQYVRADKDINPDACTDKDEIKRTIFTETDLGFFHGTKVDDSGMVLDHGEAVDDDD
jgi:hypothetical protein